MRLLCGGGIALVCFLMMTTCYTVCPRNVSVVNCFVNPCQVISCLAYPSAICVANYCGGCHAHFYINEKQVQCAPCDINNGDCHVNATCSVVDNAASCSCKSPYVGDGTHCTVQCGNGYFADRFTGKCKTIQYAFSTELRILRNYIPQYDNTTSPQYLQMKRKIESTINSHLHTRFDGYEVAHVTSFRAGNNNDYFYVDFDFVMNKYMENSFLFSSILNMTVAGDGFKTLNVDKTYTKEMHPFNKCRYNNTNNCHTGLATCTQTGSSFTCLCKKGYVGNGVACDGPMEALLNKTTAVTELSKTLYQVAAEMTNTDIATIQNYYRLSDELRLFVSITNFQNLATCLDLSKEHSIDFAFQQLKFAWEKPKDAITQFLARVKANPKAASFYSIVLVNYASSFISFCNTYPVLLTTIGYPQFLNEYVTNAISISLQDLNKYSTQMQVAPLFQNYAVAQWTGRGQEKSAKQFSDYLIGYYEGLTVASFDSTLQKGRDTIMSMNLIDITVEYVKVSAPFLKGMFKLGKMTPHFIRVVSDLSLNQLDATLGSQLSTSQMSIVFKLVNEKGTMASTVGSLPMVVALERVGITGLSKMSQHNLMSLFEKSTQQSEDFLKSWFDINQYLAATYKRDKLEKYLLINFPSMHARQLISFPNFNLADKSWMSGVTSVESYIAAVKNEFLKGMKFIIQSSPISYLKKIYEIDDYTYEWWPLAYAFTTYSGLPVADLNQFLPAASINLMSSLTLKKLELLGPKSTMTLEGFSTSLIASTQNMKLQDFLSSQVYTLQKFRNQNVDTMKMKLKDLVMRETGVAFDKIDLGHGKATLQDAAEHTLTDMQREFIQTVKQAHKKDYTSISEISETITLRQMITMVIHPDAVFLLQKYSALTQKMVELQQTEEMTLKDVLVTFTGLTAAKIEAIITSYIAHSTNSKSILAGKVKDVNTKFRAHLTTITLSDIIMVMNTDEHASAYLPLKFLPYTCANSSFTFDNKTTFSAIRSNCFANSLYMKIVNYVLADEFTADDVASLKGDTFKLDVMNMDYMSAIYFVEKVNKMLNYAANLPFLSSAPSVGVTLKQLETTTVLAISLKICQQYYPVTRATFAKVFFLKSSQISSASFATFAILKTALQIDSYKKLFSVTPLVIFQVQAAEKTFAQVEATDYLKMVREMGGVNFQSIAAINGDDVQTYADYTIMEIMKKTFGTNSTNVQKAFGIEPADTNMLAGIKTKDIMTLEAGMLLPLGDIRYHSPISLMSIIQSIYPYQLHAFLRTRPVDIATRLGVDLNSLAEVKTYILNNAAGVTSAQIQEYVSSGAFGTTYVTGSEVFTAFMNTKLNDLTSKFVENMGEKTWMDVLHHVQKDLVYEESMNRQMINWEAHSQVCFTSRANCTFRDIFTALSRDITREATRLNLIFSYVPFLGETDFVQARGFIGMTLDEMKQKTFKQLLQMTSNEYDRLWGSLVNQPIIDLMTAKSYTGATGVTLKFDSLLQLLLQTNVARLENSIPYKLSKVNVDFLSKASFADVNEAMFTKTGGKYNLMFVSVDNIMNYYTGRETLAQVQAVHAKMMKTYLSSKPIVVLESLYGKMNMSASVLSAAIDFLGYTPELMKSDGVSAKDINTVQQTTKTDFAWIFPKITYSVNTAEQLLKVLKESPLAYIYSNSLMSLYISKGIQSDAGPSYLKNKSLTENIQALTGYNGKNWFVNTTDRILTSLKAGSFLKNLDEYQMIVVVQRLSDYSAKTKQKPETLYDMKTKDLVISMYDDMYKCNDTRVCETSDANSYCFKYGPFGYQCHCKDGYKEVGHLCLNVDCNSGNGGCHVNATCTTTDAGRMCKCHVGFSGDGATCADVDECKTNNGGCHKDANCINEIGSSSCKCKRGYFGDGKTCIDLNECELNNGGCHGNATCTNTLGSRTCQCKSGFNGDGFTSCNEINECLTSNGGCHVNATCTNTIGSRMCTCKTGYTGDGITSCADLDECKLKNGGCHSNATCTNSIGSFSCACKRGFVGDGKAECNDIDECTSNNGNCHGNATCINTLGSRTCKCNQGFSGDAIDQCHDINECEKLPNGGCHQFAVCRNTNGSYTCECKIGFYGNGIERCIEVGQCGACHNLALCNETSGKCECRMGYGGDGYNVCADLNECKTNNGGCHDYALCTNIIGSYSCSCNRGFTGDGSTCIDLNECKTNNGGCHDYALCTNSIGSYSCSCNRGYTGDGNTCNDLNECKTNNGGCHDYALCTNSIGSHSCFCNRGFTGDGKTCSDENECLTNNGGCHRNAFCDNTIGSRNCKCNNGYTGDGINCNDVNECLTSNGGCHDNATCTNTIGSRSCQCKIGFHGDGFNCNATLNNECNRLHGGCHSEASCRDVNSSRMCICNNGYRGDGINNCADVDECKVLNGGCHQNATCTNVPGTRMCTCEQGFFGNGAVVCFDLNECELANGGCHNNATCQNNIGSRTCTCKHGFTGDGINMCNATLNNECNRLHGGCHSQANCRDVNGTQICVCNNGYHGDGIINCTDINECNVSNGGCHDNATCANVPGSRTCRCKQGFYGDGIGLCMDFNECGVANGGCHGNATCTNIPGSRTCKCKRGYLGDGINACHEITSNNECNRLHGGCHSQASCRDVNGTRMCVCNNGYHGDGINNCTDINECRLSNGGCHVNATCINTMGSRTCACNKGFFGNGINLCVDLNECEMSNGGCHTNATCTNTIGSRRCQCNKGFGGDGVTCNDINECKNNNGGCHNFASCTNTEGSRTCSCNRGFSGDGITCSDINECKSNNGGCHRFASCSNTEGSRNCACNRGFSGDGMTCTDLDECKVGNGGCHANATCTNTPGSRTCTCKDKFTGDGLTCLPSSLCGGNYCHTKATCVEANGTRSCQCNTGYTGSGVSCSDINECKSDNKCHKSASCSNTDGSYTCTCARGYGGDGVNCTDIDECKMNNGGCHKDAICSNTEGSRNCKCKGGFIGDPFTNCIDLNECEVGNGGCHTNANCTNTPGSRTCACKSGFYGIGTICEDINECLVSTISDCHVNSTCVNTKGSFMCTCEPGYSGDGKNCKDIDECATSNGGCHNDATCTNSMGSFACRCKAGYFGDGNTMCMDLNECDVGNGGCHANATCTNTPGSRTCACNKDFSGDGFDCKPFTTCGGATCHKQATCVVTNGTQSCQCNAGYSGNGVTTCADVDECKTNNGGCHSNASCSNTIGSFTCSCVKGFSGDGRTCTDIDECKTSNGGCHRDATCTNIPGSRDCACKQGFTGNGTSCADVDECLTNSGGCHGNATCRNTIGGHVCKCKDLFVGDGINSCNRTVSLSCDNGNGGCHANANCKIDGDAISCVCKSGFQGDGLQKCDDIDECLKNNGGCHQRATCSNSNGSRMCKCQPGYTGDGLHCKDVNECLTIKGGCHRDAICINSIGSRTCRCIPTFVGNGTDCTACSSFHFCAAVYTPICAHNATHIRSFSSKCQMDLENCLRNLGYAKDKDGNCGAIPNINFYRNMTVSNIDSTLYDIAQTYANTSKALIQQTYPFKDELVTFIEKTSLVHIATCLALPTKYSLELIFRKLNMAATSPQQAINGFLERLSQTPEAKAVYDVLKARNADFIDYCKNYPQVLSTLGYRTFLNEYVAKSFGISVSDLDTFSARIQSTALITNYAVANWTGWGKPSASLAVQGFIMTAYSQLLLGTKNSNDITASETLLNFSTRQWNISSEYMKGLGKLGNLSEPLVNVMAELPWSKLEVALGIQNINSIQPASSILRLITIKGAVADTTRMLPLMSVLLNFGFTSIDQMANYTLLDVMTKYARTNEEFLSSWFQFQPIRVQHMKQYAIGRFFAVYFPTTDTRHLRHIALYTLSEPLLTFGSETEVRQKVMTHYMISIKMIFGMMPVGQMKMVYGISDLDIGTVPFGMLLAKVTGLEASQMPSVLPYAATMMMRSMTLMELLAVGGVSTTQTVVMFANTLVSQTKEMRMQEIGTRPVTTLSTHYGHSTKALSSMSLKQYFSKEIGVPYEQIDFGDIQSTVAMVENDNVIQMQVSLAARLSQLKQNKGASRDGSTSSIPSSLTAIQLAVVSAHREAIILLRNFSSVLAIANLTLDGVNADTTITYGVLMKKYGIASNAVIKTILSDFLIDFSKGEMVINKPIRETITLVGKSDVTSLTLGEMVTLYSEPDMNVVLPFRLLKYRCKQFKFDVTSKFDQMKEACFKNSPFLKLTNSKILNSMTLANLETLAGNLKNMDAMNFNFMSAVAFTDMAYRDLLTIANKPLIVSAYEAGITFEQLNIYNIVTTTLVIFRKVHPVTDEIIGKLFNINSDILLLAKAAPLELLRQMSGAANIQLLYSSPINVIFQIATGMKTVAQTTELDLPGMVDKLSKIPFGKLYKMYNVREPAKLNSRTFANIFLDWYGVNKATIIKTYIFQDIDVSMLSRRRVADALELHLTSTKTQTELALYTPYSLISFLLGFTTYPMQDLLLSTPASVGASRNDTLGEIMASMGQSRYGVSQTEIEAFVQRYYSGVNPTVSGAEVAVGLMKAKFNDYSDKFDAELGTSKWLNIITFVLKDLQFTKFMGLKIVDWPSTFKQCYTARVNCTFKDLVGRFERSLVRDQTLLRLIADTIPYLEQTDLAQYGRFSNVPAKTVQQYTLYMIIFSASHQFWRMQNALFDSAIIDLLSESSHTAEYALTRDFSQLLLKLAGTTLERLQNTPHYTDILNAKVIDHFENITMSRMNTELYGIGFGKTNVLFDPFNVIIKYYAGKSNATIIHANSLQIAKRYFNTKSILDLHKVWGKQMNKSKSVLYIAKEFLSIPEDKMGFDKNDLLLLNKLSIVDYNWVFPAAKYETSNLPIVTKNARESSFYIDIAVSSLNQLNQKQIDLSRMRLTTALGFLTKLNAANAYWFLYNRTLAMVGGGAKVLPNHGEFSNIMTNQELGDYAAATKTEESVLYSMKVKDLQMKMYNDLSICSTKTDYCVSKDTNSECQLTSSYGHQCQCKTGYAVNTTGIMCTNINECLKSPCDVNANCNDTIGSYTCSCKSGFNKQGDKCVDVNECLTTPCHSKAACKNTNGSFSCGPCETGYSGNGFNCTDVNECSTNNGGCHSNATCTNTVGYFTCKCKSGFTGTGTATCTDINECSSNNGGCNSNRTCINTPGSFTCGCKTGFTGTGATCTDINECSNTSICAVNAACTNSPGSYKCECKSGYTGTNGKNCTDIDECTKTPNLCQTKCNNVPGGYTCDPCPDHQSGNGTTCTDECKLKPCPEFAKCTNINSGRACKCETGMYLENDAQGNPITCKKAAKVIELSGLKLKQNFEPYMNNLTSREAVEFMHHTEKALLAFLQTQYPGLVGVHITGLSPGSVNIKFLAHFKAGNHTIPSSKELGESVSKGVEGNGLKGIGAVPSPLESSDKNVCQLGTDTCGQHGTCVPKNSDDYTCDCNVDYVEIEKKCIKDDDLALKIALPIVIILLLVLFIGGACYSYHNNKKMNRGNQYEIDIQTTKGYYTTANEKGPAELVSYDQSKKPQRDQSVVKLYVEDIEGNRFPVPDHQVTQT